MRGVWYYIAMIANWCYIAAAFLFIIGTIFNMTQPPKDDEEQDEEREPFGFNVKDGGVVDSEVYEAGDRSADEGDW